MSQYRLDISGNFNLSDYSNISDYIELVDTDDKFTINFDNVSSENIDIVCSMLQEKNFLISGKDENKDGQTCIAAIRKKYRR